MRERGRSCGSTPDRATGWPCGTGFETGTIAFEVRGKNELQRSFVGVAFHGELAGDEATYEAVYFRPFNMCNLTSPRPVAHGPPLPFA